MPTGIYPEIYAYENPEEAKVLIRQIKDLYALHSAAREARDERECHKINGHIRDAVRRLPRRVVRFSKGRDALIAWLRERYVTDYTRQKRNTDASIKASMAKNDYRYVMSAAESIGRLKVRRNVAETLILVMSQKVSGFKELEVVVQTFLDKHVDLILDGEAHAYDEDLTEPITDSHFIDFARREILGRIHAWANGGGDADPGTTHKFLPTKLHDVIDR